MRITIRLAAVFIMLTALSSTAAAQGVTATVSGTIKDAQGATVPGATVTLISESRGTTLASVVTNAEGDFVIPNITADTYTLQVAMPSFKVMKRTGLQVSAGARIALGAVTIEVGPAPKSGVRARRPSFRPRRSEVLRDRTESVASLPPGRGVRRARRQRGVRSTGRSTPASRRGRRRRQLHA